MPCASLCFLLFNCIFQGINEDETRRLVQDSQVCLQMPDRSVLIADKVFSPTGFRGFCLFLVVFISCKHDKSGCCGSGETFASTGPYRSFIFYSDVAALWNTHLDLDLNIRSKCALTRRSAEHRSSGCSDTLQHF